MGRWRAGHKKGPGLSTEPLSKTSVRNQAATSYGDLTRQIQVAGLGAAQLARAGAGQGARRDQFDDAVHAVTARTRSQISSRKRARSSSSELRHWTSTAGVSSPPRCGDREGGDVARLEAGKLLDCPFDVLRPVVAAVDDDHVLGAADDVDIALRHSPMSPVSSHRPYRPRSRHRRGNSRP
ncbi:unnamed protein product [Acanthosepion pharaonis]|uniref:Uncharacterized protein n=1 Tax=Acanthosepion pharaonis TaxID=158019 RepID=A0A812DGB6_ACAPH|nr:unnamed protein product [Sepia pharaonis]